MDANFRRVVLVGKKILQGESFCYTIDAFVVKRNGYSMERSQRPEVQSAKTNEQMKYRSEKTL